MLGSIFSAIGSSIGRYFGSGIISTIGRYAGKIAGNYLERKWFHKKEIFHNYKNIRESFYFTSARYGSPIPLIFGKMRIPGKIIWTDKIKETGHRSARSSYFKHPTQVKSIRYTTTLEYHLSFAVAICEGEIAEISRVWAGSELIDISKYTFRLYKGSEEQLPDPLINSHMLGNAPAFRDLAYIVFINLPLADFGDNIPNLSFEVTRKARINKDSTVEDMVKSMVMIPGSGEYVYDTKVQTRTIKTYQGGTISSRAVNSHNIYNIANSVHSLNQLQLTCENIEWIAPVVCWFGNSLNAKDCLIRPAIEFNEPDTFYSEEWKVANYTRDTAYKISRDGYGNPKYGGSINDASVIRYLQEIKSRKLKIMFYPMLFLDLPQKPWRGRLTCSTEYIKRFFQKKEGYNQFILHYARLVKDHVDAFVIGSELIGLTRINDNNKFPAVDELVSLAKSVKQIVGSKVLVTYAADWSEYHHTEGGWYNLDPLWSSKYIDFIGIDAYFPVTESATSTITPSEIAKGWMSGEGYDYYINHQKHQMRT